MWDSFRAVAPAPIRRMKLVFGTREKLARLPETAWGLSRFEFDRLMFHRATLVSRLSEPSPGPNIQASGRKLDPSPRGNRLFGFKAHFEGPASDAVELYFFNRCYVGIAPVENGKTNVCGLGPEDFLRRFDFDYDQIVNQSPALSDCLRPLRRSIDWLSTGPLRYGQNFDARDQYLAGDALSFVDPFTGSGLLAAVKTGALAGAAAARGESVEAHLAHCRTALRRPFEISSLFRTSIQNGFADWLVGLIPARALFALTRPR
jgi:flavin-dependent dehydrogenase